MAPGRGGEAEGAEEDPLPSPYTPPTRVVVEEETEVVKTNLCCLQGCLATSAVAFAFLVALPTGILLLVWSQNNKDTVMLSVGSVLVTLPVITLVLLVLGCLNQHRLLNCRKSSNQVNCGSRPEEEKGDQEDQGDQKYMEKY